MHQKPNRLGHIPYDPDNRHDIRDTLTGIWEEVRVVTKRTVFGLLPDQLDWQYAPGWNTIGSLLAHIAANENLFCIKYLQQRAPTAKELQAFTPASKLGVHVNELKGKTLGEYFDMLDEARARTLQGISLISEAQLKRPLRLGGRSNLSYAVFHEIEDELQHKGQMLMILKLMLT